MDSQRLSFRSGKHIAAAASEVDGSGLRLDGSNSSVEGQSTQPYIITGIGAWDMRGSACLPDHHHTIHFSFDAIVLMLLMSCRRDMLGLKDFNPSDASVDSLIGQVVPSKSRSGGSLGKSGSRCRPCPV